MNIARKPRNMRYIYVVSRLRSLRKHTDNIFVQDWTKVLTLKQLHITVIFPLAWSPSSLVTLPLEVGLLLLVNKESRVPEIIQLLDWQDRPELYITVLEHPSPCKDLWDYTMLQ